MRRLIPVPQVLITALLGLSVAGCENAEDKAKKADEAALREIATKHVITAIKVSPVIKDWRILNLSVNRFEGGTKQGVVEIELLGAGGFSERRTFHYEFKSWADEVDPDTTPHWGSHDAAAFIVEMVGKIRP